MNMKTISAKHTTISASKEKLMEDLRLVVADAEELLRATANQAGEGAAVARARIQENLQVVKGRLASAEDVLIERTRDAAKEADRYVHDNPWQAIWHLSLCRSDSRDADRTALNHVGIGRTDGVVETDGWHLAGHLPDAA